MAVAVKKYNPGFLSDHEIIDSFCVRTAEFDSLVESLRESDASSSPHSLVIGPRGSGKTHLLLRVAAEVRRHPPLAGLFPIVFAEESYEVTTCGEFWLGVPGPLGRTGAQRGARQPAPDLRRAPNRYRRSSLGRPLHRLAARLRGSSPNATATACREPEHALLRHRRSRHRLATAPDPPNRASNHPIWQRHQPLRRNRQPRACPLRPLSSHHAAPARTLPNARRSGEPSPESPPPPRRSARSKSSPAATRVSSPSSPASAPVARSAT